MDRTRQLTARLARISYQSLYGVGHWHRCIQEVGAQLAPYSQYLRTARTAAEAIRPKVRWRKASREEARVFEARRKQRLKQSTYRVNGPKRPSGDQTAGTWVVLEESAGTKEEHEDFLEQFLDAAEIYDQEKCPKEAAIEPIACDYEGGALLLPEIPQPLPDESPGGVEVTRGVIWLRIDTYALARQSQAIRELENSPLERHAPLVRLMTTQASWLSVDPSKLSESDWVFLRPEVGSALRDGTDEQRRFVEVAMATPDFAILEGPPGSGKTTAICELIVQLARQNKRVLLVASTHVAVDNVLERLLEHQGQSQGNEKLVLPVRIGDEKRITSEAVLPWRYDRLLATWNARLREFLSRRGPSDPRATAAREMLLGSLRQGNGSENTGVASLLLESSNLVCGTTIGILQHPAIRGARDSCSTCEPFDVMILDEASKTTFAEFLVPALYARRWIVVGDIRQLSPYVEEQYLEDNLRGLLAAPQAAAAFHAFHAERQPRLIQADKQMGVALRRECEARKLAYGELDSLLPQASEELPELLYADLFFGKMESIHALQHRLPLGVEPVNLPEIPADWGAACDATQYILPAMRRQDEEEDWARAVAWRLIRSFELRQNPAESTKFDRAINSLVPRSLGPEWFRQQKSVAQRKDGTEKNPLQELRRQIDHLQRCAMPSILELLQVGFRRISEHHESVALTDGLPESVLDQRLVTLSFQHRMHEQIARFPRERFYSEPDGSGPLLRDSSGLKREWTYRRYSHRAEWLEVRPKGFRQNGANENHSEADQLMKELSSFVDWASSNQRSDSKPWEVAVLTFYRAQEALLRRRLRAVSGSRGNARTFNMPQGRSSARITLCTVDRFQGHEADLVFLSFVKSGNVGFLNSPNRLNVALTRARYQLVLIGDRTFFKNCNSDLLRAVATTTHYPATISFTAPQ